MAAAMIVHPADISMGSDGSVSYQGETSKSVPLMADRQFTAQGKNYNCGNIQCTGDGSNNVVCTNIDCHTTGPTPGG